MITRIRNVQAPVWKKATLYPAILLFVSLSPHPAQARDGAPLSSPFEFRPNSAFNFSSSRQQALTDPDCKSENEAMPEFDKLGLTTILKWPASNNFLEKAFAGTLGFVGRIANVDRLAVVDEGHDKFRLFLGSTKISPGRLIYCGFSDAQYVSGKWADAGFENKTLYEQLPEYTAWQLTVIKLSTAYSGMDYGRVRASLLARGFTPVPQPQKPVDRCAPGFESVCFQFKEAGCNPESSAEPTCAFEWRSAENDDLAIAANLQQVPGGDDQISVIGAIDLNEPSDDEKADKDDPSTTSSADSNVVSRNPARDGSSAGGTHDTTLENTRWQEDVHKLINDQASFFKINGSGAVSIGFDVSATGEISNVSVAESSGNAALDATAVQMVQKAARVRPPPEQQTTHMSLKLSFL